MKPLLATICLVSASVLPSLAASAEPGTVQPVFRDLVAVDLVLVDVVVEGHDGEPALDLERDDFRLLQDGQEVEISQFTPPRGRLEATSGGSRPSTAEGDAEARSIVLFIDGLHLVPSSRKRVLAELASELDEHLAPADRVMVVSNDGTATVVLRMTTDRRSLKTVLREQARSGAVSLMASNQSQRALEAIATARALYASDASGGDNSGACRDVGHLADAHARQASGRVRGTIAELESFVVTLAGFEGPKILIHVSDGIPLVPGTEAYRFAAELCDGTGISKGIPNATDTTTSTQLRLNYWDPTKTEATLRELDTTREWTQLSDQANTYQVSFYTFQASQPTNRSSSVGSVRISREVEIAAHRDRQAPLLLLAQNTGGVALLNSNKVLPTLEAINDDSRFRYQLAFEPTTHGDGKSHELEVEVDRPGVTVRHRQSYRDKTLDERIADRVLAALVHGEQRNPLGVEVEVAEKPSSQNQPGDVRIRVRVPLERLALVPAGEDRSGLFTVFVAIRTDRGQVSRVGYKTLPVKVRAGEEAPVFTYEVGVPIWSEGGEIAVAVEDEIGGEVSYLRKRIQLAGSS